MSLLCCDYAGTPRAFDEAVGAGGVRVGESHAWLQYWDGEWVGLDPTTGVTPGEFHVEIGVGREHSDVPPLKGIYSGSGAPQLLVEVEMTVLS